MFPHDSTRPKESADRGAQGEAPKSDALEKEARIQMNWSLAVVRCNWKILEVPSCNFLFGFPKHPKRNPPPGGGGGGFLFGTFPLRKAFFGVNKPTGKLPVPSVS